MRHNKIRDLEAELMREVCNDVRVDLELLPLNNEEIVNGTLLRKLVLMCQVMESGDLKNEHSSISGLCTRMHQVIKTRISHKFIDSTRKRRKEPITSA